MKKLLTGLFISTNFLSCSGTPIYMKTKERTTANRDTKQIPNNKYDDGDQENIKVKKARSLNLKHTPDISSGLNNLSWRSF
jgi:hypothetical protein